MQVEALERVVAEQVAEAVVVVVQVPVVRVAVGAVQVAVGVARDQAVVRVLPDIVVLEGEAFVVASVFGLPS